MQVCKWLLRFYKVALRKSQDIFPLHPGPIELLSHLEEPESKSMSDSWSHDEIQELLFHAEEEMNQQLLRESIEHTNIHSDP